MSFVSSQGVRRERFLSGLYSKLILFVFFLMGSFCIAIPEASAGDAAKSKGGTNAKLTYQKDDDDANFDEPILSEIDPLSMGNSSLAGPDDIADSNDGCIGTPRYDTGPEYVVNKTEWYVDAKDKVRKSRLVYDYKAVLVRVHCGARLMRTFVRCTKDCPPRPPTPVPDLGRMVQRQVGRELLRLEKPQQSLFPKPSSQAPVPGMPFFYGVADRQFDTTQEFPLTACGLFDCVSVLLRAKPIGVYFDPGDGIGKRKTCVTSGPAVSNREQAAKATSAENPCFVVFQKAGTFNTRIYLRYQATWTFSQWTLAGAPLIGSGTRTGTTSRQLNITVHERQPVVVG
jgi:hypothetical protein